MLYVLEDAFSGYHIHIHTRPTENVPMITFYNLLNSENKLAIPLPVLTIKK